MATVPIEIILQDAEVPVDPTPTPENGEETNIVVPNTGTISNDGSNNGGTGSTISIILPIVIAVLALSAMVALLVRRQQKRKKANDSNDSTEKCNTKVSKKITSRKEKLATVVSGTIAILAATVLVGNLVIPATKAASDETNSNSDEGTYIETEDKVSIVATIDKDSKEPTIVTVKDTLYATTDASGYTVTMSMIEGTLTSNLYLNGDESSEYYIAPVEVEDEDENENATKGVELATNTWGYRLSEDDGYLPVPLADTPAIVAEGEVSVTHEEINVYYGLKVDGTLPLGTYSGEIEYNITPVNPIDKLTYMQDFAKLSAEEKTALIASMPEEVTYALKDKRDERGYTIAKLKDGKIWMTENLDLPGGTKLYEESSDVENGHSELEDNPYYVIPTSSVDGSGGVYNTPYEQADRTVCSDNHPCYSYYSWTVATATSGESLTSGDAPYSICPKGWRLPSVSGGDFSGLITSYGSDSDFYNNAGPNTNLNFTLSGAYAFGAFENGGRFGNYWSSTLQDGGGRRLDFGESYVNIGYGLKLFDYAIRCLAR